MESVQNILIALFAAVPPTLVAWAALRQARKATDKAAETKTTTDEIVHKAEGLQSKVDEVHLLTNSNFSKVLTDQKLAMEKLVAANENLATSNARVAKLEALATKLLEKLNGDQPERDELAKAKE